MGCFSACLPNPKQQLKSLRPIHTPTSRLDELLRIDESIEALPLIGTNELFSHTEDLQGVKLYISVRKKVSFNLNLKFYEPEEGELLVEENGEKNKSKSDSSSSSLFSFPPDGYRYQNCSSDDEFDQIVSDDDESDSDPYLDEEDDDSEEEAIESSESLFSLSIDSRKHKMGSGVKGEKEVNSPMPVKDFDSVLNPVENLSQWKAIKARAKVASQNKAKENKNFNSIRQSNIPEAILKPAKPNRLNREIDTSLSTWLVDSGSASVGNSPPSETSKDRPILGGLSEDDIKELFATSTPRKSLSRTPRMKYAHH